jgi:hypothetical protein
VPPPLGDRRPQGKYTRYREVTAFLPSFVFTPLQSTAITIMIDEKYYWTPGNELTLDNYLQKVGG